SGWTPPHPPSRPGSGLRCRRCPTRARTHERPHRHPARRGRPGRCVDDQGSLRAPQDRNELHVAVDGIEALKFVRNGPPSEDAPRRGLILVDLNLPKMDGREVLAQLKDAPELRSIPVVVLTTSEAEEDILRSYDLHANAYVTKPVDFNRFVEVVRQIDDFF